jgi:hypothetical protein
MLCVCDMMMISDMCIIVISHVLQERDFMGRRAGDTVLDLSVVLGIV